MTSRAEALRSIRKAAAEALAAGELSAFLGDLERVRTDVLLEASNPKPNPAPPAPAAGPKLLSAVQVAERLGRSKWWVYTNKNSLPIVRFPTGGFAFRAEGLERWIIRRSG